ncbi:dephospho-CoA kinase [Microbacterium sp.]|uniref:dephospho-CoA kinase n=1 Tax=Microbacterium sp. TaxID=51671 RepID=UPI00262A1FDD|nr:dephospho-CoA kinase [Microbacterium sp.]
MPAASALLVALTGGIGAGKSTVAAILESAGARLIDADSVARDVVAPSAETEHLRQQIAALLGDGVTHDDGSLDRQAIADRVFADEALRRAYNGLIHPAIRDEVGRRIADERCRGGIIVHEIPLLSAHSSPLPWTYDVIVTVEADAAERADRLSRIRGYDSAEAWRRIRAQGEETDRVAIADIVVRTDADRAETSRRALELWDQLTRRASQAPDAAQR